MADIATGGDPASKAERSLPADPGGLTPDLLTHLISSLHPGVRVDSVEVLQSHGVGGMVSTAGRGKLRLRYASDAAGMPQEVQFKMIVGERGRAPSTSFETEVNMYRRMLPDLPLERAFCLAAEYEPDTENFFLLLEDLTLRGATFTNVLLPPYAPDEVGVLLDQLATLHAHYWKSPKLDAERSWLSSLTAGPQFEVFDGGVIVDLLNDNVAKSPYRQDVVTRIGRSPAKLWDLVKAVQRHQSATLPLTLCHGDTGAHNTYRLPNGRAGFVDWQLSVKAAWPHDVHYLICTALSVEDRRLHERALVERYLDRLRALGVDYAPSLDAAMAAYSLAIVWGFTIGWFTVWPEIYGMEIISANMERLLAAASDHDSFARAEALP
jgi:hypothetical protein